MASVADAKRVIYTNLRILDEPRMCGICVESPRARINDRISPAWYSVDITEGRTTFVGDNFCARHLPSYLRRQLPRETLLRRYSHLVRAMQYAAILAEGEALGAIRDLADHPRYGGAEAIVHYGGPQAVIAGALRCRAFVRQMVREGRITPYRPCTECGGMTSADSGLCSRRCEDVADIRRRANLAYNTALMSGHGHVEAERQKRGVLQAAVLDDNDTESAPVEDHGEFYDDPANNGDGWNTPGRE